MITPDTALSAIPDGLRIPLLEEFRLIINHFMERRWTAAELFGGRFCEVVYTVLNGYANGTYATSPCKPADFVGACRQLERNSGIPRSFQILIPRLLPALYEIRNNRNVGHVGGDVDPDFMDSSAVVSISSWVLAELIRVFHGVSTTEAQAIVDSLAERRHPLVWNSGELRRVLNPSISLKDQILLLIGTCSVKVSVDAIFIWSGQKSKSYFLRLIRQLHNDRFLEYYEKEKQVELLPPGFYYISDFYQKYI